MTAEKITILGAGSVRCMPSLAAACASFFGERPLHIALYDSDEERLDLFDRLCRVLFTFNRAGHSLSATPDPIEALEEANRVILCMGQNCAVHYFRVARRSGGATGFGAGLVDQLVELLCPSIPDDVEVLSLLGHEFSVPLPHYRKLDWPAEPTPFERAAVPHQILRFLNGEEYPHDMLAGASHSPLKAWLEDPTSVPSMLGQRDA